MGGNARDSKVVADDEQWWRTWWARDYSWEQLAAKPLEGFSVDNFGQHITSGAAAAAGAATQQEFWRDARLIPEPNPDGQVLRYWTPAHLPLTFESGRPAKSKWTESEWLSMEEDLESRIRKFAEDGIRVQLEGLVLRRLPAVEEEDIFYARTAFIRPIEATLDCRSASFHETLFVDRANFDRSTFQHGASFERALFRAGASFRNTKFGSFAQFRQACFKENAEFQNSTADVVILSEVHSESNLNIDRADARCFYLVEARLSSLSANYLQTSEINLTNAKITTSLEVSNTKTYHLLARSLDVSGWIGMANTAVDVIGMFEAVIGGAATFVDLKCPRQAVFTAVRWMGRVEFKGAEFGDRCDFRSAVFEKAAVFDGVTWPDGERVAGTFQDAVFHRLADFRGETPPSPAGFDGSSFRSEVQFNRLGFAGDRLFRASLLSATNEAALVSLENGCRALKLAAEAARDRLSEQRFHRYELICRRRSQATPRSERFFSSIGTYILDSRMSLG